MHKKIIKYSVILFFSFFFFLFNFGQYFFKSDLTIKKELTEKEILKFEEDIKNGKDIDINNYVVKKKNYSNKLTSINSNISHFIEKSFRKLFKYFIKNIDV